MIIFGSFLILYIRIKIYHFHRFLIFFQPRRRHLWTLPVCKYTYADKLPILDVIWLECFSILNDDMGRLSRSRPYCQVHTKLLLLYADWFRPIICQENVILFGNTDRITVYVRNAKIEIWVGSRSASCNFWSKCRILYF